MGQSVQYTLPYYKRRGKYDTVFWLFTYLCRVTKYLPSPASQANNVRISRSHYYLIIFCPKIRRTTMGVAPFRHGKTGNKAKKLVGLLRPNSASARPPSGRPPEHSRRTSGRDNLRRAAPTLTAPCRRRPFT